MQVITIGNFDGVHLGHQKLIKEITNISSKQNLKSCLVTFERMFSIPRGRLLMPIEEKIEALSSYPIDKIVVLPDEKWLWDMSPEKFVEQVLFKLNPSIIVVGYDFRFGKDARGTSGLLCEAARRKKIRVKIIPPVKYRSVIISSSRIRSALMSGDIRTGIRMLGREYSISGFWVKGENIASGLGFPTINLETDDDKLLPEGIYCGAAASAGNVYGCVVYIGKSPTLKRHRRPRVEFHIIGGPPTFPAVSSWKLFLSARIRREKKFRSVSDLKNQIKKDIIIAGKIFSGKKRKFCLEA